jgi:hypothetical protein
MFDRKLIKSYIYPPFGCFIRRTSLCIYTGNVAKILNYKYIKKWKDLFGIAFFFYYQISQLFFMKHCFIDYIGRLFLRLIISCQRSLKAKKTTYFFEAKISMIINLQVIVH